MKKSVSSISLVILGLLIPNIALAAREPLDWKTHGLIALAIATVGALFWVRRNKSISSTPGKIMGFGIYFWVLVFLQAMLYGIYYGVLR